MKLQISTHGNGRTSDYEMSIFGVFVPYLCLTRPPTRLTLPHRLHVQELESLARDIERLEVDVTAPALSDATTDPTKACARLQRHRARLFELQVSGV